MFNCSFDATTQLSRGSFICASSSRARSQFALQSVEITWSLRSSSRFAAPSPESKLARGAGARGGGPKRRGGVLDLHSRSGRLLYRRRRRNRHRHPLARADARTPVLTGVSSGRRRRDCRWPAPPRRAARTKRPTGSGRARACRRTRAGTSTLDFRWRSMRGGKIFIFCVVTIQLARMWAFWKAWWDVGGKREWGSKNSFVSSLKRGLTYVHSILMLP